MGVQTTTIQIITCDLCRGAMQSIEESNIEFIVGCNDADLGPNIITGTLRYDAPYAANNGIICKTCKKKWLTKYIESL